MHRMTTRKENVFGKSLSLDNNEVIIEFGEEDIIMHQNGMCFYF